MRKPFLLMLTTALLVFFSMEHAQSGGIEPVTSPHFVDATPGHFDEYAAPPVWVVINFNTPLRPPSRVSILNNNNIDYARGTTIIDPQSQTLRQPMKRNASDGAYTVEYVACHLPLDQPCDRGLFAFIINRDLLSTYADLRGQTDVTISLKDIKFSPRNMRISRFTVE